MGSGKLYHPTLPPDNDWPRSWSDEYGYFSPECMPEYKGGLHSPRCNHSVPPPAGIACGAPVTQCPYPHGHYECVYQEQTLCLANTSKDEARFEFQLEDQRIRDSCSRNLELAANAIGPKGAKGFFVGCGFHKPREIIPRSDVPSRPAPQEILHDLTMCPHADVPWIIPQEFIDLYPQDLDDIPLAEHTHVPVNMPDVAWHFPYDCQGFHIQFNGTCNQTLSRIYRRGYAAAVSYSDYNIGVLLDKLDALDLTASTLVAVIGDHGWHLGDADTWAKMTNFESAVRIPLIIKCPWKTAAVGKITSVLAEAVDLCAPLCAMPSRASLYRAMRIAAVSVCSSVVIHLLLSVEMLARAGTLHWSR